MNYKFLFIPLLFLCGCKPEDNANADKKKCIKYEIRFRCMSNKTPIYGPKCVEWEDVEKNET